jgi:hypothetical protein
MPTPKGRSQPPANGRFQCGSLHTRIVGQSGKPPVIHRRCEDCGCLSSRLFDDGADTGSAIARENQQASAVIFRNPENNFEIMFQTTPRIRDEETVPTRRTRLFTEEGASSVFEVRVAGVPPHYGDGLLVLQDTMLFTVIAIGTAAARAERNDFLNSFKVLTLGLRGG